MASSRTKAGQRTAALHALIHGWAPSHTSQRNVKRAWGRGESVANPVQSMVRPEDIPALSRFRSSRKKGICFRAVLAAKCAYTHSLDDALCSVVWGVFDDPVR
jgi:hypothetical protein